MSWKPIVKAARKWVRHHESARYWLSEASRASRELVKAVESNPPQPRKHRVLTEEQLADMIRAARAAARVEALEEAAKECDGWAKSWASQSDASEAIIDAALYLAGKIRQLKEQT